MSLKRIFFETSRESLEVQIARKIKTVAFSELPKEYQTALIVYFYEGDVADWSLDEPIEKILNDENLLNVLIDDYQKIKRNRHKSFGYGEIPSELLTVAVTKRLGYNSWDDYHTNYIHSDNTDHGNSVIPIIMNFDNEELIEDGWHRFHSYIRKGMKLIPSVVIYTGD
jgi:hypothetical protein